MPMSSTEGKSWTHERIARLARNQPISVLDIGPGVGTYAKLLRDLPIARITAIEIWEPYLRTYRLAEFYDEVIVADARTAEFPDVDVVILGDVAEHMTEAEALALWDQAGSAAALAVYLSIPIVAYPQGHIEGNAHETHVVDDWNHDRVIEAFPGIGEFWTGTEVGVYERLTRSS
jgi:SAM-dependent methyltransferase